ncbi:hypothetical protein BT67DRAFT_150996 [Trichocladium antarcticum]|uniref:Secreted protein n=1 Tax=Trichocladium antarcticum TaxID=1450529 RepID=A0AAN6ZBJ8_9PEZI|nr:hypothetical protein BT67DRAFT_150996 [Trichocladium antarcticum]
MVINRLHSLLDWAFASGLALPVQSSAYHVLSTSLANMLTSLLRHNQPSAGMIPRPRWNSIAVILGFSNCRTMTCFFLKPRRLRYARRNPASRELRIR